MNNKTDEVFVALLKAKQNIAEYTRKKVENPNWVAYYNGITENLDNIINDYTITTKISDDEILCSLFEVGADDKSSIYYDMYINLQRNI